MKNLSGNTFTILENSNSIYNAKQWHISFKTRYTSYFILGVTVNFVTTHAATAVLLPSAQRTIETVVQLATTLDPVCQKYKIIPKGTCCTSKRASLITVCHNPRSVWVRMIPPWLNMHSSGAMDASRLSSSWIHQSVHDTIFTIFLGGKHTHSTVSTSTSTSTWNMYLSTTQVDVPGTARLPHWRCWLGNRKGNRPVKPLTSTPFSIKGATV